MLYYWEPSPGDPEAIAHARSSLNLDRDVVATDEEIGTSTYLVTRSYVNSLVDQYNNFGDHFNIVKSDSGWKPVTEFPHFSTLKRQLKDLYPPPPWIDNVDVPHPKPINKFCVIAQQDKSWLGAYVYWETEQRLILWHPGHDDDDDVLFLSSDLNLRNGISDHGTVNSLNLPTASVLC